MTLQHHASKQGAEQPAVSLFKLHNKLVYPVFLTGLAAICFTQLPAPYNLHHFTTGAVLGGASCWIASQAIASRDDKIFKSVLLGLSVFIHVVLLDGYKQVQEDYAGALIAHVAFILIFFCCYRRNDTPPVGIRRNIEGAVMYTPAEVSRLTGVGVDKTGSFIGDCFNFASVWLPFAMFAKHTLVIGMSETGKSIWHTIMQAAFFTKPNTKGIIHDYASNMTAKLLAMGVDLRRITKTNVFDRLGYGWLISDDAVGKSACKELGKIPFPINKNKGGNDYFPRTAADIVGSVIYTLYRLGRDAGVEPTFSWSDVLNCCMSRERIYAVLSLYPDTRASFGYLKNDGETNDNLMSTVRLGLQEFEAIAALGHRAIEEGRIFSAKRWITSNQLVLLGRETKRAKFAIAIYNAAIVNIMVRTILSREVSDITPDPYIGIYVDEAANIGKIRDLVELTREARRHGVSINLANQDVASLQELYGKGEFASVTGQIKNFIYLTLSDPNEQKLAAEVIGKTKYEKLEESTSDSNSYTASQGNSKSASRTYSWKDKEEYLIMPSAFQNLSRVDFGTGRPMGMVAKIDTSFNFAVSLLPSQLLTLLPPKPTAKAEQLNYNPVPPEWEELEPLNPQDYERLCLPPDIFDDGDDDPDIKDDDVPFIPV